MEKVLDLKSAIRDVPDFPKKGIIFKDITPLLGQPELFKEIIEQTAAHFKTRNIDKVLAIESRGFIFGGPLACELGAGFVPIRKKGKLPYKTASASYSLEYGTDTLEMHEDAFKPGERVLIADDLLATGGTAKATAELAEKMGGKVAGFSFLIVLEFLNGRKKLEGYDIFSLIQY